MLKEIHLAGSVRTPFGSFCGAFAESRQSSSAKRGGAVRVKPEDIKELLVEHLSGSLRPKAARQIGIGGASSAAEWESQWPLN